MPAPKEFKFMELPEELAAIDEMIAQYEGWESLDPKKATREELEADEAAREKLGAAIERRIAIWGAQLRVNGKSMHNWLRRLRHEEEDAAEEAARTARLAEIAAKKHQRLKEFVLANMRAMGLKEVKGPGWKIAEVGNGGIAPFQWTGDGPLPLEFAHSIEVRPDELVRRVQKLAPNCTFSGHSILAYLLDSIPELEPSSTRFYERVKQRGGEAPEGFEILPRGKHLEIR